MAFKNVEFEHLVKFNSSRTAEFLDSYDKYMNDKLIEKSKELSHKTFAPSSFRCLRRQWFRLRGVEPDCVSVPDRVLDFSAEIGTACHRMLQKNFKDMLGDSWLDVGGFVDSTYSSDNISYVYSEDTGETLVQIVDPPVRFACDGLIRLGDKVYLLEIKSSEYASWNDLTQPKPVHIDQIRCYCALLDIHDVIFVYIDRQYGGLKCFEYNVSYSELKDVLDKMNHVIDCVKSFIAPDPLPQGDPWCTPSMCPYYKKCGEYGRALNRYR